MLLEHLVADKLKQENATHDGERYYVCLEIQLLESTMLICLISKFRPMNTRT